MEITINQEGQSKKYLILIFLLAFIITILIIWKNIPKQKQEVEIPSYWKEIRINFDILNAPSTRELKPFEKISPYTEQLGKNNPFLP
jgi:hypothetical protein